MVMLVFALPEEARVVRRRVRSGPRMHTNGREGERRAIKGSRGIFAGQEVSLAFVGVGAPRIAELERAMELLQPRLVICSGFAGATRTMLEAGDFVLSTNFTDPEFREILSRQKVIDAAGPFVQVREVASATGKWSLNRSVGSLAVDMESESIAELCRRKRKSVVTARMISDAIDESIPAIFSRRKAAKLKDLSDAAVFAARMLRLTERLADRLEALVRVCGEAGTDRSPGG